MDDAKIILAQLSRTIREAPQGKDTISINYGLHFTGGEPFLNFDLLLSMTNTARAYGLSSTFVETNCFWCTDDRTTRERLKQLRAAGLHGILISVNPFILEHVPFANTQRAVRISEEIFHDNVILYQTLFYRLFQSLAIRDTLPFKEYFTMAPQSLEYAELLPLGRVCYNLGFLFTKYPAKQFFGMSCTEELTRAWHVHIDNYCNYLTGYCAGISLGDARNLASLCQGINLDEYPVLSCLVNDLQLLYELGTKDFAYQEPRAGYISKCHMCLDIRRHIMKQSKAFKELQPPAFYVQL